MATLLGTANIQGAFTTTSEAVVVTDDLNRVTQTVYRGPTTTSIEEASNISWEEFRPIYAPALNRYNVKDYFITDNGSSTDYVELVPYDERDDFVHYYLTGSGGTSQPLTTILDLHYDFLEIDPASTIDSIQIKLDIESGSAGYDNNLMTGDLHYGKVRLGWRYSGGGKQTTNTQTITTDQRQTLDFTITPDSNWLSAQPKGLGNFQRLEVDVAGVFTGGLSYANRNWAINHKIYNVEVRVNYTGRTRFTTSFHSYTTKSVTDFLPPTDTNPPPIPTEFTRLYKTEGYGFSIPSDNIIDGVALHYGFGEVIDASNTFLTSDSLHLKKTVSGTHTRVSTSGFDPNYRSVYINLIDGVANGDARTIQAQDDDNSNLQITTADVNDSTFGMEARFAYEGASTRPLEPVVFDLKIAYVGPIVSGDISINTTSTLTATPNLIHGFTADQINELSSTTTLTALGGFLLEGAPQTQAATFTTTLGTAGRIRPGQATSTSAFTVTATAVNDISGSALTFPTATMTVSAGVERTTPANINTAITLAPTGLIGRIRTNHTATAPAVATVPALTDIFLIKAPAQSQVFTCATQTRTYIIPIEGEDRAHERRLYIPQQTRTYTIPIQGEDRAHERRLYVPQQTRSVKVEALQ